MNIKELFLHSMCEKSKDYQVYLKIWSLVDEDMNLPDHVKEKYPVGSLIMLIVDSYKSSEPYFDFETKKLSFILNFSGVRTTIYMNVNNIIKIADMLSPNEMIFNVLKSDETIEQESPIKPKSKKSHLSIVR